MAHEAGQGPCWTCRHLRQEVHKDLEDEYNDLEVDGDILTVIYGLLEKKTIYRKENIPARGEEVGIGPKLYERLLVCNAHLDGIRAARAIVDKLAEVLRESDAKYQDEREALIGQMADAVKSAAKRKDRSLLGPFEATVAYNAQVGVRAAKTRRKKAEEAAQKKASGARRKAGAKRAKAAQKAVASTTEPA